MTRYGQLRREARRRIGFVLERSPLAFAIGGVSNRFVLETIGVATLFVLGLAAAGVAGAQTFIGPGAVTSTQTVTGPGTTTVVGNTTIKVPSGDGIDAPGFNGAGPTLNINTEAVRPSPIAPPPGPGPISITSGGTGVASIFPSSAATISIDSGPHGDVTIMSGGAALGMSGDVTLAASNANGDHLMFESTGAFGVVAQFGAKISVTGATITADSGVGAVLIGGDLTNEGAIGNLTNVDIVTTDLVGLDATRMGTVATMTNGSITVSGAGLAALYSDTNGVTNVTNVKITTAGDDTYGAFAEATIPSTPLVSPGGGTINITGGSITTEGVGSFGVFAQGQPSVPSTITLNNSMITTSGDGAAGYRADGAAMISATNTTTQTSGAAAPGGMLSNGATVMISGGSVKTTGAGSFGFLVQPFTPIASLTAESGLTALPFAAEPTSPNVLQISNNAMVTSAADAFHVTGAVANIAVSGSSITSGNGVLLNTLLSGTTNLTATGSQLTGAITTESSSTANVTLQGNTTWTMTGSSNLTNLVNDPSTIIFTPPTGDPTQLASYKTLTVTNYTGVGGSIDLNTFLGADNSPSDRLVISGGSATGNTALVVTNTGGPGALTTGNGILIVNAVNGATTAPSAFALAGEVAAGPFDYELFRGGLSGSDANDWFLRNDFIVPGPIPPEPGPIDPLPPDPPPQPLPPGVHPIIGPRLATYGVVQPLARQLGLDILGTLHERAGDTYEPDCSAPAAETSGVDLPTKKPAALPTKKSGPTPCPLFSPSAWARFFGGTLNDRYRAFADPRADGSVWGFQGGVDLLRGSLIAGHYDRAGLFGAFGNTNANVDGLVTNAADTAYVLTRTGSVNLDAWSGGAYWTHVGPGGWYLDTVLQGTSYTGHATTPISSLATDGWGFLASLEGGYPIPLGFWPRLVLEPQGQILWQHVDFNHEFDGIGTIGLGSTSGWTGRLGLLAQSTIVTGSGQVWQPYVRANLWQDWGAQAATSFAGGTIGVRLLEAATRLEFAGGLTGKLNANWSFFGQAGYQFAIASSNERRNGFTGDIGLRYSW